MNTPATIKGFTHWCGYVEVPDLGITPPETLDDVLALASTLVAAGTLGPYVRHNNIAGAMAVMFGFAHLSGAVMWLDLLLDTTLQHKLSAEYAAQVGAARHVYAQWAADPKRQVWRDERQAPVSTKPSIPQPRERWRRARGRT